MRVDSCCDADAGGGAMAAPPSATAANRTGINRVCTLRILLSSALGGLGGEHQSGGVFAYWTKVQCGDCARPPRLRFRERRPRQYQAWSLTSDAMCRVRSMASCRMRRTTTSPTWSATRKNTRCGPRRRLSLTWILNRPSPMSARARTPEVAGPRCSRSIVADSAAAYRRACVAPKFESVQATTSRKSWSAVSDRRIVHTVLLTLTCAGEHEHDLPLRLSLAISGAASTTVL